MRASKKYFICTAALLGAGLSAFAQSREERLKDLFSRMDADHNGFVSQAEQRALWRDVFARSDLDGSGYLDSSEVSGASQMRADTNKDGLVDPVEDAALRGLHFTQADTSKDGLMTLDEHLILAGVKAVLKAPSVNFDSMNEKIDALAKMTKTPLVFMDEARKDEIEGQLPIYFDALDYKGNSTKVFGWLGVPKGVAEPMPGIVLVHGGGGTAYHEWVKLWNDKGFAALAIGVEGQTDVKVAATNQWERHEWAGPARSGIYGDSGQALEDQWMYHAVANTILANSLLSSFPEVDAERVGLMGISWGGVITSTVMGIDDRFAFAIPVYGCGGLSEADNQYGRALSQNEFYQNVWDPNLRLQRATMPSLWLSWPGDTHFPVERFSASLESVSGQSLLALVPGMNHGHAPGWNRPESYAFAESIVKSEQPWFEVRQAKVLSGRMDLKVRSTKDLDRASLVWTKDKGLSGTREWFDSEVPIERQGPHWLIFSEIPQGATACFINVASRELIVSGPYFKLE